MMMEDKVNLQQHSVSSGGNQHCKEIRHDFSCGEYNDGCHQQY